MKSTYRDRETVGSTYVKAQTDMKGILVGDVNYQLVQSLVEDLNESIQSNPYEGRPFYISIVEERDALMKNAIKRRMFTTLYRPFPEDNTLVHYTIPQQEKTFFCWDLPHHSEIPNLINNEWLYDGDYIHKIKEFLRGNLQSFGFQKVSLTNSLVEDYDEKKIARYRQSYIRFCESRGMDAKGIENEKKLGFFWLPNLRFKYKPLGETPKISLIGI